MNKTVHAVPLSSQPSHRKKEQIVMATMVAYTALELTEAQKRALCAGVEKGASLS